MDGGRESGRSDRKGVWEEKVWFEDRTTGQREEGKQNMKVPLERMEREIEEARE